MSSPDRKCVTPCVKDLAMGKTPRPAEPNCPCVTSGASQALADIARAGDRDWEAVRKGAASVPPETKDIIRTHCPLPDQL